MDLPVRKLYEKVDRCRQAHLLYVRPCVEGGCPPRCWKEISCGVSFCSIFNDALTLSHIHTPPSASKQHSRSRTRHTHTHTRAHMTSNENIPPPLQQSCRPFFYLQAAAACNDIRRKVHGAAVETLPLDLSSVESIREFVKLFRKTGLPLHVLVNNAGKFLFVFPRFLPFCCCCCCFCCCTAVFCTCVGCVYSVRGPRGLLTVCSLLGADLESIVTVQHHPCNTVKSPGVSAIARHRMHGEQLCHIYCANCRYKQAQRPSRQHPLCQDERTVAAKGGLSKKQMA